MKIIHQRTRTLTTRDNGRSSDAVSPNFVYGCLGGCMSSYCYVGRYNHDRVYINDNTSEILHSVNQWVGQQVWPKQPNQVDPVYYTIDIGCSTDVALMSKHYNWQEVFDYFSIKDSMAKSTFATKYPSMFKPELYSLNKDKHRIRVSLMPQKYSDVLEPNTDSIRLRIEQIPKLQKHLEVHINFSPIIYEEGWLDHYRALFQMLKDKGIDLPCECIFLTHNKFQHERNSEEVQALLWKPEIQEDKDSNYATGNIRYEYRFKHQLIQQFKELYSEFFDVNNIRYIF